MSSATPIIIFIAVVLALSFSAWPAVTVEEPGPTIEVYAVEQPQPEIPEELQELSDQYGLDFEIIYTEPGEFPEGTITIDPDAAEIVVERTGDPAETSGQITAQTTVAGTWHNPENGYVIRFLEDGTCDNDHGFAGTYTVEGNVLTIVEDTGYTQRFTFRIEGDTMTLENMASGTVTTVTRQ